MSTNYYRLHHHHTVAILEGKETVYGHAGVHNVKSGAVGLYSSTPVNGNLNRLIESVVESDQDTRQQSCLIHPLYEGGTK